MDWARMLAYITGTVDQELLARNEYIPSQNIANRLIGNHVPEISYGARDPIVAPVQRDTQTHQAGLCNVAKGWAGCCVIIIKKPRNLAEKSWMILWLEVDCTCAHRTLLCPVDR
jgi:hypothetical protein